MAIPAELLVTEQDEFDSSLWDLHQKYSKEMQSEDVLNYLVLLIFIRSIGQLESKVKLPEEAKFDYLYCHRNRQNNDKRLETCFSLIQSALPELNEVLTTLHSGRYSHYSNESLSSIISTINNYDLYIIDPDLSNTISYLLKRYTEKYTQRNESEPVPDALCELVSQLIEQQGASNIYDPCCGTGELLLTAHQHLQSKGNSLSLYGEEVDRFRWALAKLQFYLRGVGHSSLSKTPCIARPAFIESDTQLKQFDVVISSPPYANRNWSGDIIIEDDSYQRFSYGVPPKSSGDYGYISHILASTKSDKGMAVVILPQGVLYRGAKESKIREQLIRNNLLDTVIVLPEKLLSGSLQPLTILIFSYAKTNDDVLFIDASKQFKAHKMLNIMLDDEVASIVDTFRERKSNDKYSRVVPLTEVVANNFNCNIPRYINTSEPVKSKSLSVLDTERQHLLSELENVGVAINESIESMK